MVKKDQTEREIERILAATGGGVTLDYILAQLFHRCRVTPSQENLHDMLARMIEKGSVAAVAGKEGLYRTASR